MGGLAKTHSESLDGSSRASKQMPDPSEHGAVEATLGPRPGQLALPACPRPATYISPYVFCLYKGKSKNRSGPAWLLSRGRR